MRRALSISLILLLWLPAVAALLPGAGEARLPFCCRRQGAHHCAMDANGAAAPSDGSGRAVSAPSLCSQFPSTPAVTTSRVFVPVARPASGPALLLVVHSPGPSRDAARAGRLRAQLDRGPPASAIA
jgi:hypothetical protein